MGYKGRKRFLFFFIFVLCLNLCDILVDWLFYAELNDLRKGLVFGPVDPAIRKAVLAFAIVSSILNVIEIFIKGKQLHKNDESQNDILTLIVIIVGEMPLVVLNVITACCREESLSIFQLSKASVILFGNAVRMVVFFATNCTNCKVQFSNCKVFVVCLVGLILNCLGSIAIFILTQTRPDSTFNPTIKAPEVLFADIEENSKYFGGVSVYFQHDVFKDLGPYQVNFMRLARIDDIRSKEKKKIYIKFQFNDSQEDLEMFLSHRVEQGAWESPERYTYNKSSQTIHVVNRISPVNAYDQSFTFVFDFLPPTGLLLKEYVFGEIEYNVQRLDGQYCSDVSVPLFYFRTELSEESHLLIENGKTPQFYTHEDLIDIADVWKTGWLRCQSTGSVKPTLNTKLDTLCID